MMAYVGSHTKRYTQLQCARTDLQQGEPIESMHTSVTAVFSGRGRSTIPFHCSIPLFHSIVPFRRIKTPKVLSQVSLSILQLYHLYKHKCAKSKISLKICSGERWGNPMAPPTLIDPLNGIPPCPKMRMDFTCFLRWWDPPSEVTFLMPNLQSTSF